MTFLVAVTDYDRPSSHPAHSPGLRLLGPYDPGILVHMPVASNLCLAPSCKPVSLAVLAHATLAAFPFVAKLSHEDVESVARLDGEAFVVGASVVEACRVGGA